MTRPAESIYAQLVEHGLDAAFLTRPEDGAILYANPAACRLFGYTLDEFRALGRSAVVDLSDPRIRERWHSVWRLAAFRVSSRCGARTAVGFWLHSLQPSTPTAAGSNGPACSCGISRSRTSGKRHCASSTPS